MTLRIAAATAAAAVVALYLLRLDGAAGLYVDDAWYIVLATALQRGEGFRLISSAATPILPAVPPGFPLLLAPVVALFPQFPDNVVPLKLVSVAAMLGAGAIAYRYLRRWHNAPRAVSAVVALMTVLLPAFVFLATSSVMAEGAFTVSQLALAWSIERWARSEGRDGDVPDAAVCGLLAAATMLIRAAGVAAVAACGLYLLKTRGPRRAVAFAAVTAICYAPWTWYVSADRSTPEQRAAHGGSIAFRYDELMRMRSGEEPGGESLTVADYRDRIAFNLVNVFGRDVGALVFPGAYRGALESGQEAFALSGLTGFRASGMGAGGAIIWVSSLISAIVIAGFFAAARRRTTVAEWIAPVTIAMVILVPARTFRYVLPLAPFVAFYFFCGVEWIVSAVRRTAWHFGAAFRIAAACVLTLITIEHAQYLWYARNGPQPLWLRDYGEVKVVTDWMNSSLPGDEPVASSNPGLIYLATGRKGIALGNPRVHLARWQDLGIRYAVAVHMAEQPSRSLKFRTLFASPRLNLWVAELPARADRKSQER